MQAEPQLQKHAQSGYMYPSGGNALPYSSDKVRPCRMVMSDMQDLP